MHRSRDIMLCGVLVLVQLVLSGWNVLGALIIDTEPSPLIFTCYRESIALVFLYAVAILLEGVQWPPRNQLARLSLLGLLNYGNIVGFVLGLNFASAWTVALYQCAIPVFTAALVLFAKQEQMDKVKLIGIMVAVLGALIATIYTKRGKDDLGSEVVLGNLLLFGQAMSLSAFLVLQRPLLDKYQYPYTWVAAWGYTGAVILIALSAFYYSDHPSNWSLEGVWKQVALVYAAIVASGLVQNLMAWSNMITTSTIVATFTTLQPLFTSLIYYCTHRKYGVTVAVVLGALVSVVGITLACYRDKLLFSEYESDDSYIRFHRKTSTYDQDCSDSTISQSTQTKQSIHYHTPADRIGLMGTGYTPITSDTVDRLRATTETMRISRIISNDSQTQTRGVRKWTKWSTSPSFTAVPSNPFNPLPSFS